jgi:hypothetical protein
MTKHERFVEWFGRFGIGNDEIRAGYAGGTQIRIWRQAIQRVAGRAFRYGYRLGVEAERGRVAKRERACNDAAYATSAQNAKETRK